MSNDKNNIDNSDIIEFPLDYPRADESGEKFSSPILETYANPCRRWLTTRLMLPVSSSISYKDQIRQYKQMMVLACMAGYDQISDYYYKSGNIGHSFDIQKLKNDSISSSNSKVIEFLSPSIEIFDAAEDEKEFPYSCIFKSYGTAGFVLVLEDGTFYMSNYMHMEHRRKFAESMLRYMRRKARLLEYVTKPRTMAAAEVETTRRKCPLQRQQQQQ